MRYGGICFHCKNDTNPNSLNFFDYPPQPQYQTYSCENYGDSYENHQCQPMDQHYDPNFYSSLDQYQPLQFSVTHQLPQRPNQDMLLEMAKLIKNNLILFNSNIFPDEEMNKQYQPEDIQEFMCKLLEDVQNINEELSNYTNSSSWNHPIFYDNDEHSIQYMLYLENYSKVITPVSPIEEPEYSLSMEDEHLSTTSETELDEIIKSSVENLVPIPSEYEGILDDTCDVPICKDSSTLKDHFEILSDFNDDDTSSDDDAFEDIEFVEASLPDSELVSLEEVNDVNQEEKEIDLEDILQIQDVILREKLLSINHLIADIEFLNDNPTPDRVLKSSSSFPIPVADSDSFFEKSDTSLSYSDNSLPEFETFSDHTKETRSGSTTAHANNSLPEYDSFRFEIEPDQGRLTSVVMDNISDDSTNDPILEAVNLFLLQIIRYYRVLRISTMTRKGISILFKNCLAMIPFPFPKMSHLTLIIMMIRYFLVLIRNHRMMRFSLNLNPIRVF
nr:hypothetical protein [Tanacetum cinerariifolium]